MLCDASVRCAKDLQKQATSGITIPKATKIQKKKTTNKHVANFQTTPEAPSQLSVSAPSDLSSMAPSTVPDAPENGDWDLGTSPFSGFTV